MKSNNKNYLFYILIIVAAIIFIISSMYSGGLYYETFSNMFAEMSGNLYYTYVDLAGNTGTARSCTTYDTRYYRTLTCYNAGEEILVTSYKLVKERK